jgi:hypothetical protein
MQKNSIENMLLATLIAVVAISCQKQILEPGTPSETNAVVSGQVNPVRTPYKFERINQQNFRSQGWMEQQVNIVGTTTIFSDSSDHVEIVCGPDNESDPRLIQGSVTMNLPTTADPTLRRIRLRKGGYSGTLLGDLTELKYSTYVVHNSPAIIVLQIDVNGDSVKDFNIFYEPRTSLQPAGFPPLVLNTWQQWDPLHQGVWHIEVAVVPLPGGLADRICTIPEIIEVFPGARIIDTPPVGHNGEGVRFTIGGNPRSLFDNTIGYFDALIIGTRNEQHSTLYDFTCNQGNN